MKQGSQLKEQAGSLFLWLCCKGGKCPQNGFAKAGGNGSGVQESRPNRRERGDNSKKDRIRRCAECGLVRV